MSKKATAASEAVRVFSSSSPEYHAAFRIFLASTDQKEKAMDFLDNEVNQLSKRNTFLDVGAGTGKLTAHLASAFQNTFAIEPNPALVSELRSNCPKVSVFQANIADAVIPQEADFVLCSHVFYYIPRNAWLRSLEKIAAWLAVDGVLAIALQNPNTDCMKMVRHFLKGRFDLAGLATDFLTRSTGRYSTSLTTVRATIRTSSFKDACSVAEFMLNLLPMPEPPLRKQLESYVQSHFHRAGAFEFSCDQDFLRVQRLVKN